MPAAKPRPLSQHVVAELRELASGGPQPACGINPRVKDRLLNDRLAEATFLRSPFPADNGRNVQHLRITQAGRQALAEAEAQS
jgi:hypothetical protein